jgi:WS/DGAT/MGAT family acyltransferase
MDRLSPLDASFLYLDTPTTPMTISSLAVYEGPPPAAKELRDMLASKLHLVPRFRQRLAAVPFGWHRPMWVDDTTFDIDEHLQHVEVSEGTETHMLDLAAHLLSQPLCRSRPLWEMCLITGLENDRFAILSKTHHSLWDGVSGVDLHAVLLDDSPTPAADGPAPGFRPTPEPTPIGMLVGAARDRVRETRQLVSSMRNALRDPLKTLSEATRIAKDATSFATSLVRPAPATALNGPNSSRRKFAIAHGSLNDVKDLRMTLGASVNDVILAAVGGAMRQWQLHRAEDPQDMRVMVPVSLRSEHDAMGGNRVAMVVVDLPVAERTSLMRLDRAHKNMERAKTSGHIAAGEAITRLSSYLPPTAIAAMSKAQAITRPFNLLVTNIPGPQMPLYLLGRKLLELYPQAPLAANQGLSVAALSYNGKIAFGLLADDDMVDEVDFIARALEGSLDDIVFHGGLDVAVPAEPSTSKIAELTSIR